MSEYHSHGNPKLHFVRLFERRFPKWNHQSLSPFLNVSSENHHVGMPFESQLPVRSGRKVTLKRVQNKVPVFLFPNRSFTIGIPIETRWRYISIRVSPLVHCKDFYSKWAFGEQKYRYFVLHSFQHNFSPRPNWKLRFKWRLVWVILWRNVQKWT